MDMRFRQSAEFRDEQSDDELVQAALHAAGDSQQAFETLLTRHEGRVKGVLRSMLRNDADVQEEMQEVFLQAYLKLHTLKEGGAFGGWIAMIARRIALNHLSRKRPSYQLGFLSPDDEQMATSEVEDHRIGSDPVEVLLEDERSLLVRNGVRRLDDQDRESILAFYVHGEMLKETSERMGAPLGTIKRRLHYARKRLAEALSERHPGVFRD